MVDTFASADDYIAARIDDIEEKMNGEKEKLAKETTSSRNKSDNKNETKKITLPVEKKVKQKLSKKISKRMKGNISKFVRDYLISFIAYCPKSLKYTFSFALNFIWQKIKLVFIIYLSLFN